MSSVAKKITLESSLRWLLATFLFLLPWQTVYILREAFDEGVKFQYATLGFHATEVLLWICVMIFIVWYWKKVIAIRKNPTFSFSWTKDRIFVFSCLLFVGFCYFSVLWAPDRQLALQHSLHILEAFLAFFMILVGPLRVLSVVKVFVASSVFPSVLGVWQGLAQSTFSSVWLGMAAHPAYELGSSIIAGPGVGRWLRAYGPMVHPNIFGGFLTFTLVGTLFLFRRHAESQKHRIWLHGVFHLQAAALFFTFSRSAIVAFGLALLIHCFLLFVVHKRIIDHMFSILYSIGVFVVLGVLFSPIVSPRLFVEDPREVASVSERVSQADEAKELFLQSPLLGVGVGNYTVALHQKNDQQVWKIQPVHNVGLLFLAELGIVGVLLVGFIIVSLCRLQKKNIFPIILFVSPLVPLLLFDHYLFSSYVGLMLVGLYWGIGLRFLETKNSTK